MALAQAAPWNVVVTETPNPLPIGNCGSVYVTVTDPATRGRARNPIGQLVSIADFDMTATATDPTAVVGVWNDPNAWSVCTCQVATIGMPVTVTATYPAKLLPARRRAPGVAIQQSFTFPVSKSPGTSNPAGCPPAPGQLASGPSPSATQPGGAASGAPVGVQAGTPTGAPAATPVGAPTGIPTSPPVGTPAGTPVGAPGAVPAGTLPTAPSTVAPTAPSGSPVFTAPASGVAPGPPVAGAPATTTPSQAPPAQQPAQPPANTPNLINPTGLTATEIQPGTVALRWKPVSGSSYYVVTGTGSSYGGVKVTDTTFVVTGVPAGAQDFLVGSYYLPGPMSTPASKFTKVTVQANGPAQTSTYRVVATGFRVNKEAVDDALDRDGLRNEVYASFSMFHFKDVVDYVLLDQDLRRTFVYGDTSRHPGRVRAGTASVAGGLRNGDAFPPVPTLRAGAVNDSGFPLKVWEGSLTDGADFVVICSQLWEWSGISDNYDAWFPFLHYNATTIWSQQKGYADWSLASSKNPPALVGWYQFGPPVIPPSMTGGVGGINMDRPIGVEPKLVGGGVYAGPLMLILSRRNIEEAFKNVPAAGPQRVLLTGKFSDSPQVPSTGGDFSLYLDIERVP